MYLIFVNMKSGRKQSMHLMFMLGLKETMDKLAMANSVRWYGHVLRREDGHVLIWALDLEVEFQCKKGRLKMTWIKQVEVESVFEKGRNTLLSKVECRHKNYFCWVGVNLATPHFILNIGVSLTFSIIIILLVFSLSCLVSSFHC